MMRFLTSTSPQPTAKGGDRAELPSISGPMWRWFAWYARRFLRKHFHAVRISKAGMPPSIEPGVPMVVFANHPSWWDPMVAIFVASELWPRRRHYFPIDAAMLRKYSFFGRLGFFGVGSDDHRGASAFLRTAGELLDRDDACLWLTPQGSIADVRQRPLCLKPGLAHLTRRAGRAVFIPAAIEYSFWNERTPEVLLRWGQPIFSDGGRHDLSHWQDLLTGRLQSTMDALSEEAIARDPRHFHLLLGGTSGTSPIYDLIRRTRAACAGERFDASHVPEGQ
jgi:1-acyl-sn-glycerol-3-phosphate acyltransferase